MYDPRGKKKASSNASTPRRRQRGVPVALRVGSGGWVEAGPTVSDDGYPPFLFVQMGETEDGLRPVALVIEARIGEHLTDAALRALSPDLLSRVINREVGDEVGLRLEDDGGPISSRDVLLQVAFVGESGRLPRMRAVRTEAPARILVKRTKPLSEEFFAAVADTFDSLAMWDETPITTMARANSVSLSTLNKWIAEARRRGLVTTPPLRGKGARRKA